MCIPVPFFPITLFAIILEQIICIFCNWVQTRMFLLNTQTHFRSITTNRPIEVYGNDNSTIDTNRQKWSMICDSCVFTSCDTPTITLVRLLHQNNTNYRLTTSDQNMQVKYDHTYADANQSIHDGGKCVKILICHSWMKPFLFWIYYNKNAQYQQLLIYMPN